MASFLIYELFINLAFLYLYFNFRANSEKCTLTKQVSECLRPEGHALQSEAPDFRKFVQGAVKHRSCLGDVQISGLNFVSACLYHRNSNIAIKDQLRISLYIIRHNNIRASQPFWHLHAPSVLRLIPPNHCIIEGRERSYMESSEAQGKLYRSTCLLPKS